MWSNLLYGQYSLGNVQRSAKRLVLGLEIILVRGLVKLVPAVAYHFCLNLPATFSQPRTSIISGPSTVDIGYMVIGYVVKSVIWSILTWKCTEIG